MQKILDRIWALLTAGANAGQVRSPFTMVQIATLGLDGAPRARTVVLRQINRSQSAVTFHTDIRSEKVAELKKDPRIAVVACDLEAGLQIRLEGIATIVDRGERKDTVWNANRPRTLILYRAPLRPGTPIGSPGDAHVPPECDDAERSAGSENFCLVDIEVSKIDYLDLSPSGHVRVRFIRDSDSWQGIWVAP
ncbi:pyridoxamine 5'-phosphate oxidase family protein [Paraburkholderia sp. HD33-4]|uniref:pyridoxamine 5'-phosphate oxidase family protein n=1 Tax=Paraburkholderia sp. HD33-4 TaxID=2883242 RepID=UPI001F31C4D1|nr:pyridoxamine 5'-phosphate oxidase family protein [Paraburkholderia sp. HD33-4]